MGLLTCFFVCCCPMLVGWYAAYTYMLSQELFDAQSFVSRLLGFGDVKGLMRQLQESQDESGDPKEMMCAQQTSNKIFAK